MHFFPDFSAFPVKTKCSLLSLRIYQSLTLRPVAGLVQGPSSHSTSVPVDPDEPFRGQVFHPHPHPSLSATDTQKHSRAGMPESTPDWDSDRQSELSFHSSITSFPVSFPVLQQTACRVQSTDSTFILSEFCKTLQQTQMFSFLGTISSTLSSPFLFLCISCQYLETLSTWDPQHPHRASRSSDAFSHTQSYGILLVGTSPPAPLLVPVDSSVLPGKSSYLSPLLFIESAEDPRNTLYLGPQVAILGWNSCR